MTWVMATRAVTVANWRHETLIGLPTKAFASKQGYVASPVCSPSWVGITTGQCPARQLIFSYLDSRKRQRELGMKDYLDPKVPTLARTLKNAGYATGHFGKWHMGGGRDVD